jgi:hypothetical protein
MFFKVYVKFFVSTTKMEQSTVPKILSDSKCGLNSIFCNYWSFESTRQNGKTTRCNKNNSSMQGEEPIDEQCYEFSNFHKDEKSKCCQDLILAKTKSKSSRTEHSSIFRCSSTISMKT